ncbi:hypothetical protein IB024_01295 [Brucella sp. 6810]|uniref:hypothetical protein n=1 Tax=Brucella sp. 6810 TaxID=2769351 RepID=UPI00165A45D4|nr:hypothetical protein [Brucella sp. 6810]QNQ62424.1 hypothetical protein IB024_01295 [Brucella sp. 6810]
MTDIATLGIQVNSGPVRSASGALDEFSGKAGKAERATDKLQASVEKMQRSALALRGAMGTPGERIDKRVYGTGVVLDGRSLSLRQFVCYLLGYLSFLGLIAFILITTAFFVAPSLTKMFSEATILYVLLRQFFAATMFILFSAFTTTVFWALYFLTDVVNRTD